MQRVIRRAVIGHDDFLVPLVSVKQFVCCTVVDLCAVVYDDCPPAQCLDILDVVRGQEDRCPLFLVDLFQETADLFRCDGIQTDRRLIEKQDPWIVEERHDQFHLHALPERHGSHLHIHQIFHTKEFHKIIFVRLKVRLRNLIYFLEKAECIVDGQLKKQLALLSHHDSILFLELIFQVIRIISHHIDRPCQHLDQCRLAGSVWTDQSDKFARLHGQADVVYCHFLFVCAL